MAEENKRLPLEGLRILDLTTSYSGPIGTMQLADFGADVIKVEHYKNGDFSRGFQQRFNGKALFYPTVNRNKRSITLNLKSEEGKKLFLELVKTADVVVENYRGGTMEKLGLTYDILSQVNPSIIMASLCGFGQTGPYKTRGCYSNVAEAIAGTMYANGYKERPVGTGPSFGDSLPGVYTMLMIMIALYHRDRTGQGQYIDVAMVDVLVAFLEGAVTFTDVWGKDPERIGNQDKAGYPYDVFEAKDGFCFMSVTNFSDWTGFAKACELEHLMEDPRFLTNSDRFKNREELSVYINAWTRQHTKKEIEARMEEYRQAYAPVNSISEMMENEQVLARDMIIDMEDPDMELTYKMPGIPAKMSKTPGMIKNAAPAMGEHNEEIFGEIGYSPEDIADFKERGIL